MSRDKSRLRELEIINAGKLKYGNCSECQRLWRENENLRAIIRKELSENDEFGAEYVHVSILRRENEELRKEIKELKEKL